MSLHLVLCAVLVLTSFLNVSAQSYGFFSLLTSYDSATGTAHAYLDTQAKTLVVASYWSSLTTAPIAMHVHGCLPSPPLLFVGSPPAINLTPFIAQYGLGTSGQIVVSFDLSKTSSYYWNPLPAPDATSLQAILLNCLLNGTAYFNIHTTTWANGELSGVFQQTAQVNASWVTLTQNPSVAVSTTGTGTSLLLYNANTHEVFIGGTFSGLTSNATKFHWHGCSSVVNTSTSNYIIQLSVPNALNQYSAVFTNYYNLLNPSFVDPSFTGVVGLNPQTIEQTVWQCYINGSTYFNLHTIENPSGELWGWYSINQPVQTIIPSPDALTTYTALLNAYAVNGAAGATVGYATVTLDVDTSLIFADVSVFSPLTGPPIAAHIHGCTNQYARFPFGAANISVPLDYSLLAGSTSGEFQDVYSSAQIATYYPSFLSSAGLTNQWWKAEEVLYTCLQQEDTYVNIHTNANPNGEATGVLTASNQVMEFVVTLGAANTATTTVPSNAVANAFVLWDLAAHLLWVNVTYSGLSSNLTQAHIHGCLQNGNTQNVPTSSTGIAIPLIGPAGTSGNIRLPYNTALPGTFNSGFYSNLGVWPAAWYAEAQFASCAMNNSLYINLHTQNNVNGELAGILKFDKDATLPSTSPVPTTGSTSAALQMTLSILSTLIPLAAVASMFLDRF